MDNSINLYDFLYQKKIIHSQDIHLFREGLVLLIEKSKSCDGICYYFTDQFSLMNIDCLKIDDNGYYYYEFTPERNCDMIDDITYETLTDLDAKLTYNICGIDYIPEKFIEFLFVSAMFHEFKIRITFIRKPEFNDKFKINSRHWLFNNESRKLLTKSNVITKYNIYNNGMCQKLNN